MKKIMKLNFIQIKVFFKNSGFIFTSDSNNENLKIFLVFFCLIDDKIENIFYCENLLFNDKNFVNDVMEKINYK